MSLPARISRRQNGAPLIQSGALFREIDCVQVHLSGRAIHHGGRPETCRTSAGFDAETDGLLDAATKVHCIVIADLDSDRIDEYGPDQIAAALAHLSRAAYLIGHNIISFDIPVLRRLYDWRRRRIA